MTGVREEALVLKSFFCIHYPVQFKKNADKTQIQALINSKSEVNAIHPTFVKRSGLSIKQIDVEVFFYRFSHPIWPEIRKISLRMRQL